MAAFFERIWAYISTFFASYNWLNDTLDILLVAFFIFFIVRLVRDSRAEQLVKGIAVLGILYLLATLLNLTTVKYLLKAVFDNGLIVLVVIFQPEIRRALEQAGHSRAGIFRVFDGFNQVDSAAIIEQWHKAIDATAAALMILQKQKMGALVVMERTTRLGEIIRTGTTIEAEPSADLIANIFFNKAPLHDGATIIRDGMICAAGCILPLTDNLQISRELGTRHRAGVGMSENSDAVVIILSEESGIISVAVGGELTRNYTQESLVKMLEDTILWNDKETKRIKKSKKKGKGEEG
ncbi:MAG: TIGR00159 family protein [Ruminococcaceae bacterium]|nr:TIGR00159 family protein [Oscillospiraceae bacterium]